MKPEAAVFVPCLAEIMTVCVMHEQGGLRRLGDSHQRAGAAEFRFFAASTRANWSSSVLGFTSTEANVSAGSAAWSFLQLLSVNLEFVRTFSRVFAVYSETLTAENLAGFFHDGMCR